MMLGIALGVRIPFTFTDEQHTVNVELRHEDKRLVGFAAKLTTGRPPGMAGMDMLVPDGVQRAGRDPRRGPARAPGVGRRPATSRRHEIKAASPPADASLTDRTAR